MSKNDISFERVRVPFERRWPFITRGRCLGKTRIVGLGHDDKSSRNTAVVVEKKYIYTHNNVPLLIPNGFLDRANVLFEYASETKRQKRPSPAHVVSGDTCRRHFLVFHSQRDPCRRIHRFCKVLHEFPENRPRFPSLKNPHKRFPFLCRSDRPIFSLRFLITKTGSGCRHDFLHSRLWFRYISTHSTRKSR